MLISGIYKPNFIYLKNNPKFLEVKLNEQKKQLSVITLFIVGLLSLITISTSAQNKVWTENNQPQNENVESDVLQNYVNISSLPANEKHKAFTNLSAEDKANIFKLHLALQFINRPNLTKDQKDLILESISAIKPDNYGTANSGNRINSSAQALEARAKTIFSRQEGIEIFASLGGNSEEINQIENYRKVVLPITMGERRKIFQKLPAIDKSAFWKFQLSFHLAIDLNLNSEQNEVILEVINLANEDLFASKNPAKLKKLEPIIERIKETFQQEEASLLFSKFGKPVDEIAPDISPNNVALRCHCSVGSWFSCTVSSRCEDGGCKAVNGDGCGFLTLYVCDGRCS